MADDNINSTMQEIVLLKFLMQRDNYSKYIPYISELNLEAETDTVLKSINAYFSEFPDKDSIEANDLILYNTLRNPHVKKKELFSDLFSKLDSIELNSKLVKENFNSILEQYFSSEIMFKLSEAIAMGESGALTQVKDLIEDFDNMKQELLDSSPNFVTNDIQTIVQETIEEPGIKWRLSSLNKHLGELRGKTLGHVFARVDTGKTSFVLSEESFWVKQLKDDECIIHFNNEEDGKKLMSRFYQSFLDVDKEHLIANPTQSYKIFTKQGGGRFKLYDNAILTIEAIEAILQQYKVKLVVIDQSDKLLFTGCNKLGDVARLQMVYAKLRELTKKYNVHILTVGQAGQTAENKKWLLPTDLDSSKTLKPGEFDYIIGIGRIFQDSFNSDDHIRYMHLCKNKLGTGQHAQFEVILDPTRALYREPTYDALEDTYAKTRGVDPTRLSYMRS